jgi:hypothetical protein
VCKTDPSSSRIPSRIFKMKKGWALFRVQQLLQPPTPSFSGNTVAFPISTVGLLSSSPPPSPITSLPTRRLPDRRRPRWRRRPASAMVAGPDSGLEPLWRRGSAPALGTKEEIHGRAALPARRSRLPRGGAPSIRSKRRRSYTIGHGDVDFRGVDGGGAGGADGGGGVG